MKRCPRCKVALSKKQYKGVRVDECPTCLGLFFDKGELERARDNTDDDLRFLDFELFHIEDKAKLHREQVICSSCGSIMDGYTYEGSSVMISKCSQCEGVWLDKGEFDRIISYLESMVSSETSSQLAQDLRTHLVTLLAPKKKESEELKDLMAITRLLEERWAAEHPVIEKIIESYYKLTPFK